MMSTNKYVGCNLAEWTLLITIRKNETGMAKKKNLNGLPNNLIQQYFSTLFVLY